MSVDPGETNVDGQALKKLAAKKDEIGERLLGPQGWFTKVFTVIDIHILVLIIGIQSSLLNYFILKYNRMMIYYYILFGFDFFIIISIIWSIILAKKYFELQDKLENPDDYSNGLDCNPNNNLPKDLLLCRLPKKVKRKIFRHLPFIYHS